MDSSSAMMPSSALSIPLRLLDRLIKVKVNDAVIDYLVEQTCSKIKVYPDDAQDSRPPVPTVKPGRKPKTSSPSSKTLVEGEQPLPHLHDFIENISTRSRCTMATMLVALIYLDRLQKTIQLKYPTGKPCSRHRVIFSALMISHKVWNDSSMVGKHWAEVSNLFTSQEVLLMEREMLMLLKYDLELTIEEIWNVARPFMKKPFLVVAPEEMAQAEMAFATASRLTQEAMIFDQAIQQHGFAQSTSSAISLPIVPPVQSAPPPRPSRSVSRPASHEPRLVHPFSSLHYSALPTCGAPPNRAEQQPNSTCSSPAPFDPFDTIFCSPALHSSPLLASPLLQTVPHPTGANPGVISFSRTHTTRSSAGSTTRTTTRLTLKNVSHVALAAKGTGAHVYLQNHPQHHHGRSTVAPAIRLKKKRCISSVQRFHLPTSMHSHQMPPPIHSFPSPHHSNVSTSSTSSSSITTSIPSSPSCYSAGSVISVSAQSPSLVWYAHRQAQYAEHGKPYYPYAPAIAPTPAVPA